MTMTDSSRDNHRRKMDKERPDVTPPPRLSTERTGYPRLAGRVARKTVHNFEPARAGFSITSVKAPKSLRASPETVREDAEGCEGEVERYLAHSDNRIARGRILRRANRAAEALL